MTEKDRDKDRNDSASAESMVKASLDFWESTANLWFGVMKTAMSAPGFPGAASKAEENDRRDTPPESDAQSEFDRFWRAYFRSLQGAGDAPAGVIPEMALKIMEPLWNQLASFSKPAADREKVGLEEFSEFVRGVSRTWFGSYEEEMKKYLNMPQLGPMRYYQERLNMTVDRFQTFRGRLLEFAGIFYGPIEESLHLMEEEMKSADGKGEEFLKDHRAWYRTWISKLEKKYMEMLRSSNYISTLQETLKALYEYRKARQQFLIDVLQDFPIPTNREMDEVYKDLYRIKKRLKALERRGEGNEKR